MRIEKVTVDVCKMRKQEIAAMIYKSMNFYDEIPWYTREESAAKCDLLKSYIEQGNAISYIAVLNNRVEGFIWAYPCDDRRNTNRVYVSILYVNKEIRGQSIGKKLIEAVELEARNKGYGDLWLHTNGVNHNARAFYEKVGFTIERVQYQKSLLNPMDADTK